jgi:hypothetical protein
MVILEGIKKDSKRGAMGRGKKGYMGITEENPLGGVPAK